MENVGAEAQRGLVTHSKAHIQGGTGSAQAWVEMGALSWLRILADEGAGE